MVMLSADVTSSMTLPKYAVMVVLASSENKDSVMLPKNNAPVDSKSSTMMFSVCPSEYVDT